MRREKVPAARAANHGRCTGGKGLVLGGMGVLLLLVLAIACYAAAAAVRNAAHCTLPRAVAVRAAGGLGLNGADDFAQLQGRVENLTLAGETTTTVLCTAGGAAVQADAVCTTGPWADMMPSRIKRGTWYEESAVPEANRSVVVDESLALALFFTDDVVGKSLELGGQTYTICGVTKADGALRRLSGSGRPQLWLPLLGWPNAAGDAPAITVLLAAQAAGKNSVFLSDATTVSSQLMQAAPTPLHADSATSYTHSLRLLDTILAGIRFFWAALAALLLLIFAIGQAGTLLRRRAAMGAVQAGENRRWWLRRGIAAAAALALAVLLLVVGSFTPFIPPSTLPADQLFDFGHYARVITQNIQANNQYAGLDVLWNVSQNAIAWCAAVGAAAVAAFALALGAAAAWALALNKRRHTQQ